MKVITWKNCLYLAGLLLSMGSTAQATTLYVNCGGRSGLTSINGAIRALQGSEAHGPATINVSGVCNEDVVIQGVDKLTLNAVNKASIIDPSGGNLSTVTIDDARDITISGFTINGGSDGIDCQNGSLCRLTNNTVENSVNDGIGVWALSLAQITGGTLSSNAFCGLQAANGARVNADGVSVQGNWRGVIVNNAAFLQFRTGAIQANPDMGVWVHSGATFLCTACSITGNSGDGVFAEQGSTVRFQPLFSTPEVVFRVAQNGGAGVSLTNLANASFFNGGTVTANQGPLDVVCNASFTAAGGLTNAGVTADRTNCAGP